MIRIMVLVLLLISGTLFAAEKIPETLDEQLAVDNQRVMKYLGRLTPSDVGKRLKGIRLSDQNVVLKNHVFLEKIRSADHQSSVYVFHEKSKLVAYAWVEPQGRSIPIPKKRGSMFYRATCIPGKRWSPATELLFWSA